MGRAAGRPDPTLQAAHDTIVSLKSADPAKYWSVSTPGEGYKMHGVGGGFVGIKDNGGSVDVGALVAKPGESGVTRRAMSVVDHNHPFHPQTLDAFDGHLPQIYAKHGFTETGRMGFDPQYAPKEWDEAKHGRPDVVMMSRPPAQGSMFPDEYPTSPPRVSRTEAMKQGHADAHPDQQALF